MARLDSVGVGIPKAAGRLRNPPSERRSLHPGNSGWPTE
jgi:hypothetical protein